MKIRELNKNDREKFIEMCKEFYNSNAVIHSIPKENIINTFNVILSESPYAKCYIIEKNNEIAGYGLLSITYSNEAGGLVLLLEEIYIVEKFRGLGLGSEFLDFINEKYKNKVKRFRLEVTHSNEAAKRLYIKKKYKIFDYVQMVREIQV